MRYLVKQKYFAIKDRYTIFDDRNNPRFEVQGKFFNVPKRFRLTDMQGRELLNIKQKLFHLFPRYKIYQGEREIASYKGKFRLFGKKAVLDIPGQNIVMKGNILQWDFSFTRGGNQVGLISKHILKIADTYSIDIAGENDALYILAAAIIVDASYHRKH
jgi:Uncharacterized conserved protein